LDTILARLHIFNREIEKRSILGDFKGAKKDLIGSIMSELVLRNNDNPVLLADLGHVAPATGAETVVTQKSEKPSGPMVSGRPNPPLPEK